MKHLFFLFVGFLALYEIMKALNCKKVYSRTCEYRHLPKEDVKAYLKEHPMLLLMSILDIFWMDDINGWTNDKPVDFIPGGNGFVFIEISTPRRLGCVYR